MKELADKLLESTINRDVIGRLRTIRKIDHATGNINYIFLGQTTLITENYQEAMFNKLVGGFRLFGNNYSTSIEFWDGWLREVTRLF